ncbi:MAG: hypothetical protein QM736_03345 [Vicinamibacterales bacterium]
MLRDVGITAGRIEKLDANIPRSQARDVIDATGRIVTPGSIDMHVHVYDGVAVASIDPDGAGVHRGVTTVVDGGSSGATTYPGFRKHIIDRAQTTVYALLNISTIGFVVTNENYLDVKLIDQDAAIRVINANRDRILGIKVRIDGRDETADRDVDNPAARPHRIGRDRCADPDALGARSTPHLDAESGRRHHTPVQPAACRPRSPRTGRLPSSSSTSTCRSGGSSPTSRTAVISCGRRRRGRRSWDGIPTSSPADLHRAHIAPNGNVVDLATTMAKFMYLGLSFEQVVERVTTRPVAALKFNGAKIGTLAPGAAADVTICNLADRPIQLFDSTKDPRTGRQAIDVVTTIKAGRVVPKIDTN